MSRILCCGPIFEPAKSIGEDGYLYGWLEKLIISTNPTMQAEVEEMLAWMLELNESGVLLDWLMMQCYTQVSSYLFFLFYFKKKIKFSATYCRMPMLQSSSSSVLTS